MSPQIIIVALATAHARAAEDLLANGSFEERDATGMPADWSTVDGATTGSGPTSTWTLVPEVHTGTSALRLQGDAATGRWLAFVSAPITVAPGSTLELSGWVRTENVQPSGNQFENCYLALSFTDESGRRLRVEGSPVTGASQFIGTVDWTFTERVITVPEGAATASVMTFLSMSGTAWFDDISVVPVKALDWVVIETDRIRYHYLASAPVSDSEQAMNLKTLEAFEAQLGARVPGRIDFYRYPSNDAKRKLTGNAGNAHVSGPSALHTIWPVDNHEFVHLITRQWGETDSPLFGEGIAVHLSGSWQGRPIDSWVSEYRESGQLPSLATIIAGADFRRLDDKVTYPVAGSFVGYLLRTYGIETFQAVYLKARASVDSRCRDHTGKSLTELEADWLAQLGG